MSEKPKKRESRAVIVPLQGGGMVMFSCTADGADATEAYLTKTRAKRQVVDIADIVEAVRGSKPSVSENATGRVGRRGEADEEATEGNFGLSVRRSGR